MKKQQQVTPEFITDTNGQLVALVPLTNSQRRATLYAEDYQWLIDAGFSRLWKCTEDGRGSAYVTVNAYTRDGYSRVIPVARLIVNAGHGQRVRHNDGNTLNLRTENLSIFLGRSWFDASNWFPTAEALRAAGIDPAHKTKHSSRCQRKPADVQQVTTDPARTYTPRVVDRAALAARVREQMTQAAPEISTANFRGGIRRSASG